MKTTAFGLFNFHNHNCPTWPGRWCRTWPGTWPGTWHGTWHGAPISILRRLSIVVVFLSLVAPSLADETKPSASNEQQSEAVVVTYPDWFKTSFMELEEDILEAQEAGKRLMLVFHQPGCPYCNALVEQNLSQKDIEETVKSNFDVIEINMWGDLEVTDVDGTAFTEKKFAEYLKVQFTPTVLMYHPDGSKAMRMNGYFPPDKFRAALDYVINEDTSVQSFNEYLATIESSASDLSAQQNNTPAEYSYIKSDDFSSDQTIDLPGSETKRPYILLFEQRDCSNCVQFHDSVLAEKETQKLLKSFDVIRIDIWGKDSLRTLDGEKVSGRELAQQLDISYAPTMVVYSADHEEVIRSESWLKRFHTQTIFDYVLSDGWKEQPSFQRFLRERADTIREAGGTVSILD